MPMHYDDISEICLIFLLDVLVKGVYQTSRNTQF